MLQVIQDLKSNDPTLRSAAEGLVKQLQSHPSMKPLPMVAPVEEETRSDSGDSSVKSIHSSNLSSLRSGKSDDESETLSSRDSFTEEENEERPSQTGPAGTYSDDEPMPEHPVTASREQSPTPPPSKGGHDTEQVQVMRCVSHHLVSGPLHSAWVVRFCPDVVAYVRAHPM